MQLSTGASAGASSSGTQGPDFAGKGVARAGRQAAAQGLRGAPSVVDQAGAGPDQGGAAAHKREIGLGLGASVGERSKQRRVQAAHPGQVLGVHPV